MKAEPLPGSFGGFRPSLGQRLFRASREGDPLPDTVLRRSRQGCNPQSCMQLLGDLDDEGEEYTNCPYGHTVFLQWHWSQSIMVEPVGENRGRRAQS